MFENMEVWEKGAKGDKIKGDKKKWYAKPVDPETIIDDLTQKDAEFFYEKQKKLLWDVLHPQGVKTPFLRYLFRQRSLDKVYNNIKVLQMITRQNKIYGF